MMRKSDRGFTLLELLAAMAVLGLLVLFATSLVNSAATITTLAGKRMDADSQARQLFGRMAVDFTQMIKRPDVDYYLKSSATAVPDCTTCSPQTDGNDQIAFFSAVSGYYPTSSYQSPVSLVAYRVNSGSTNSSYNKLERMGKGFVWNGVSSNYIPILFLDSPTAPTTTIKRNWPSAATTDPTDPNYKDSDYELIGPQVFRFEYYYLLRNGNLSGTPWYSTSTVHGMQDVAAIVVDIAVIDPTSKALLNDAQITTFNTSGNPNFLTDYISGMTPGQLLAQWQNTLNSITGLPRPAVSAIRLYERYFYLSRPVL